jgi:tetratricopeptide (TPR) repeat protein
MRWMKVAGRRHSRVCSLAILAGALVIAGCGGATSRLANYMERGRAYYAKNDFVHASIEFRNALQIAPKDVAARLMVAHTAEKLGQFREAAGLYQSIVDSTPDNIEARASLGRIFTFVGVPERALLVVEPALVNHSDEVSLLTVRAAARARTNDMSGAQQDADHALKQSPADEDAIAVRAGLYKQAGDLPSAITLVSGALDKLPESTQLREILFALYAGADEPSKAEDQLRKLIQLRPQELGYRKQLALFYARSKKLDDAQQVLEDAITALPHSDDAKLALVGFIEAQRTREQGEKTLRSFIAKEPSNYDLRFGLADLLQRSGAARQALDTYNEIIQRDGTGSKGLLARDRIAAIKLAQNNDAEARKLIDEVLQKSPRDTDALLLRGELALKRQDASAAIADLRAVLRDQPGSVPVERMLARAHLANKEPALAEQALRAALDAAPGNVDVRIELAQLLTQTQRPEQAIALLEESVRRNPTDVRAREVLTRGYLAARDFHAARTAAEDLKTLRPDAAVGPFLAGLAAEGENRLDDAQKDFEQAHSIQPLAFEPLSELARLKLARGQAPQAIALVQSAIEQDNSKDAAAVNLLGELYLATKDIPKAVNTLSEATTRAPQWWPPYRNLALAKAAANDSDGAIAAYDAAIKLAPTNPQLVTELAQLYVIHGHVDDAIARYETLYRRNPKLQVAANNLAMLLVTYKKDRQSLDRARDVTAGFASSNDGGLLDTNGWVHFKRGEYAEALPVLQRAAERSPDVREIRYHLGMAELQAGRNERARTELETALSGSTKYQWSDDARAVLAGLKNRTGSG